MKAAYVYKQMFAALREGGIESISAAAYKIMKMPVTITDASYVVIGLYPSQKTGDAQWDSNQMHSQIITEAILAFQSDAHWNAIQKAGGAIIIDWGYCTGRPRYASFIEKNGKILGSLAFLIGNTPKESWHLEAINIIVQSAAIVMDRDYLATRNAAAHNVMFMKSLLMENIGSHSQFLQMAEIVGFLPQKEYILAGVLHRNLDNEMFSDYIGEELTSRLPNCLQMQQKDRFYLLMSGDKPGEKEQVFLDVANKIKSADTIVAAFSYAFENPLKLPQYKWQVDNLLEISAQDFPDKTILHYGDYVSNIAMRFVKANISSDNMLHPMIKRLESYDQEHLTDYLDTLKVFVQSIYSKNTTAKILNIHRNTLFYRLEKIHEITGVNIQTKETAFHLFLSFYYLDMHNTT